jgi:hypothetical protein
MVRQGPTGARKIIVLIPAGGQILVDVMNEECLRAAGTPCVTKKNLNFVPS